MASQAAHERMNASLGDLESLAIDLRIDELGNTIARLIADVGQLRYVSPGDLHVFGANVDTPPGNVREAMRYGTLIFDALYYFALPQTDRPLVQAGPDGGANLDATVLQAKKRLLWTAIFLMLRGSYPSSATSNLGTDIPAFLVNVCGMDESPRDVAQGIASFNLQNINPVWVKAIDWRGLASEIRQRMALGLAGYRMIGPFRLYEVRADASAEVKAAFNWVRAVANEPLDYAILSATRSAELISRLGSWNKALGNLILLSFTPEQINEMVQVKILFQVPTRDARSDTWRAWSASGPLTLSDPVKI